ncbi:MAG TPA: glycoside hydrolase family 3 N-terminal domain-containing protein, partial [Gemmatimonadales bacterium]|nr:glycoside hydrolase family 3 N-terminal domain-containing protein [Gemmatimonadales bacterium]
MHRTLLIAIALSAGCAPRLAPPPPAPPGAAALAPLDVDHRLAALSLRDKVAQLVMPWMAGTYAAYDDWGFAETVHMVDSLHVGGVIVSVGSPLDIAARLNWLQDRSALPLLIASDLEGGTAIRLNGGTPFPSNMGVGASGRDSDAYAMGRVTAEEGRAVGIHLAFAPVADVNSNPANPIINTRSFGEDPRAVARFVAAEVRGLEEHGMLATAKHFPGHGDTRTDSHLGLAVVPADWTRLDTLELIPFRAAIQAGVTGVMSAHVALPAL